MSGSQEAAPLRASPEAAGAASAPASGPDGPADSYNYGGTRSSADSANGANGVSHSAGDGAPASIHTNIHNGARSHGRPSVRVSSEPLGPSEQVAADALRRAKPRSVSSSMEARPELVSGLVAPRAPKPGKPRSRSSVTPRAKLRQSSFSGDVPSKPLNTHSPIAVAAAAAVTGEKIRKLLVAHGPLPIRHITSHLAATIPGFGELSLSKQRRLIIAVLDGPKSEFVKVGWGRWAVQGHTERSVSLTGGARGMLNPGVHRESISRNMPNSKPPLSPSLGPVEDSAVFSDSESEDFDDDSEVEGTDEEDWQAIGPAQLRQTSPREQDAIAALVQLRSN